ncbi:MAG TPA: hypothetical protein VIW80_12585 [Pyrinomonadaceae bacterium]|jgi:hypothetical protein
MMLRLSFSYLSNGALAVRRYARWPHDLQPFQLAFERVESTSGGFGESRPAL